MWRKAVGREEKRGLRPFSQIEAADAPVGREMGSEALGPRDSEVAEKGGKRIDADIGSHLMQNR